MASYEGSIRRRLREWRERKPTRGQAHEKQMEILDLEEKLREAMREQETARENYHSLANKAERIGLVEISKRLREIANDEKEHYYELKELLGKIAELLV